MSFAVIAIAWFVTVLLLVGPQLLPRRAAGAAYACIAVAVVVVAANLRARRR